MFHIAPRYKLIIQFRKSCPGFFHWINISIKALRISFFSFHFPFPLFINSRTMRLYLFFPSCTNQRIRSGFFLIWISWKKATRERESFTYYVWEFRRKRSLWRNLWMTWEFVVKKLRRTAVDRNRLALSISNWLYIGGV